MNEIHDTRYQQNDFISKRASAEKQNDTNIQTASNTLTGEKSGLDNFSVAQKGKYIVPGIWFAPNQQRQTEYKLMKLYKMSGVYVHDQLYPNGPRPRNQDTNIHTKLRPN